MLNSILQRQIENNNIFHSYIIEGNVDDSREQYLEFSKNVLTNHHDINNLIQIVSPENNNITIDQIRKITKAIYKRPVKYDYNIFVIEDAHFMRVEAQNALLKTLEEMPGYSIVFMTTNNRFQLLDTIISRSQVIGINSVDMIDFENQNTKNIITLINKTLEGNYYIINKERNLIKELSENKHETLFILTKIFSDALLGKRSDNIKYQNIIDKISKFSVSSIEEIIKKIENIKEMLRVNLNFQIAMEDLIFTIIEKMSISNENKKDKLITTILIFLLCLFIPVGKSFADDTYKVNEEIEFGRTYEFDEPVNGTVVMSGAAEGVQNVGNVKDNKFVESVPVKVKFTPKKLGLFKLDIEVNVSTKEGTDLSRVDTVYFLVTKNGEEMTSKQIEDYLKTQLQANNKDLINEYTKRPYIKQIDVTNAKVVETLDKNRTEYTLKIDDNAQKIQFNVQGDSKYTKINGTLSLNPNSQTMNLLSVSNNDSEVIYTFKWEKPKVKVFKYNNNGKEEDLVYDPYNRQEFENLPTQKIEIKGDKFEVYEDESGNLLIPLKHKDKDELPELYTFSTDGEIFTKFENFVNINGQTFRQEKFNEIFNEDLVLFNLESVQIQDLNYAKGYSINRVGFEKQYLVNLTRPDGFQAWYQFDDRDGIKQLVLLDFPEFITETDLAKYFGVDLDTDYKTIQYSKFDIVLVGVAIASIVIIIITNIVIKIKKRKHRD